MDDKFQSLIWVACPTGLRHMGVESKRTSAVSIPHMGCMPYGQGAPSELRCKFSVSIPHMGCMPYGREPDPEPDQPEYGFNPSYGLHALRAAQLSRPRQSNWYGFNPSYGLHALRADPALRDPLEKTCFNPSYGLHALRAVRLHNFPII